MDDTGQHAVITPVRQRESVYQCIKNDAYAIGSVPIDIMQTNYFNQQPADHDQQQDTEPVYEAIPE